jgi:hypothetical protein
MATPAETSRLLHAAGHGPDGERPAERRRCAVGARANTLGAGFTAAPAQGPGRRKAGHAVRGSDKIIIIGAPGSTRLQGRRNGQLSGCADEDWMMLSELWNSSGTWSDSGRTICHL